MTTESDKYSVVSGYLVRVEDDRTSVTGVYTIEPLFKGQTISDKGKRIATASMIRDEGILGCPVCGQLRPVQVFEETIGDLAVCGMCSGNCPSCSAEESLSNSGSSLECLSCELTMDCSFD